MKDNIFNLLKKHILDIANKKYPQKRKRKYSLEYYLEKFTDILNEVVNWESLRKTYQNCTTYHWKTIYNEFNKWSKDNIFEDAFYNFINKKYFKISQIKKDKKLNLLIDVTKITNKLGSEKIAINGEYKKKNVTSITAICDQNKLPLSISVVDINKTLYNGRKTSQHEVKNVQNTLNNIKLELKDYVDVNLIGDKGYITQEKFKVMNKTMSIITPKKRNQRTKNTQKQEKLLKLRSLIEYFFSDVKKNIRIMIRKEKQVINYLSFMYIAMLEIYIKYALKNDLTKYII